MAKFALLMIESPGAWGRLPEAEQDRLMGLYGAWVGELRAAGAFVDGWPFGGEARLVVGGPDGITVAEPAAERPSETGLFLIEAQDIETAAKLARGCPALLHGETVIVRAVGHA